MFDVDSLSSLIGKEAGVISGAPALFAAAIFVGFLILWTALKWRYDSIIAKQQATIDHFKARGADGLLGPTAPEPGPGLQPQVEEGRYLNILILGVGQAPDTTTPVRLVAEAKMTTERLRIIIEPQMYSHSINWAGWVHPRQLLLADLSDVIRGSRIEIPVVTCNADGSEAWWGQEKKVAGDVIFPGHRYRATLRFVGPDGSEQLERFFLARTFVTNPPRIVEVFREGELR